MKNKNWKYYLSVAHFEELFHARINETPKYVGCSDKLKKLMYDVAESGLLIPAPNGITYISNNSERIKRINLIEKNHNTLSVVEKAAKDDFRILSQTVTANIKGIAGVKNEDIYMKIWEQENIQNIIKIHNTNATAKNISPQNAFDYMSNEWKNEYGDSVLTRKLAYDYLHAHTQIIDMGLYESIRNNFFYLEFVVEFLFGALEDCGYKRDKKEDLYISSKYDTQHSIMSSYCDLFITSDAKLKEKFKAIAYYLGIPIKVKYWKNGNLDE